MEASDEVKNQESKDLTVHIVSSIFIFERFRPFGSHENEKALKSILSEKISKSRIGSNATSHGKS